MKKTSVAICLALIIAAPSYAANAAPSTPKVGDCFFVSPEELDSPTPISNKISCSFTHNLETYFVGKVSGSTDPNKQSEKVLLNRVKQTCLNAWKFPETSPLNYFAFYVPTSAQWKAGSRWLRCDGGIASESSESDLPELGTWKGSAVNSRGNVTQLS